MSKFYAIIFCAIALQCSMSSNLKATSSGAFQYPMPTLEETTSGYTQSLNDATDILEKTFTAFRKNANQASFEILSYWYSEMYQVYWEAIRIFGALSTNNAPWAIAFKNRVRVAGHYLEFIKNQLNVYQDSISEIPHNF